MGPFDSPNYTSPACRAQDPAARLPENNKPRVAPTRGSGDFMVRWSKIAILVLACVFAAGCPKGKQDYKAARHAVDLQDYDAAVDYYLKALKGDPHNVNYKI